MSRVENPPARGTRPRNRREITVQQAALLFARQGYPNVSMSDIARAMNVGASAIYRHFGSKADLLMAAISSGIDPYRDVLAEGAAPGGDPRSNLDTVLVRLAEAALEHRELGVLWQREARNLRELDQKFLRDELSGTASGLSALIEAVRPELTRTDADLLSWCTLGALVSVGFHSLTLPHDEFVDLLVGLASAVVHADLSIRAVPSPVAPPADDETTSRRDILLAQATELFAERGYGAVGIDDIGDAAGIAGPSVYSHFASKQTILAEAVRRGNSLLHEDLVNALRDGDAPEIALGRLVDSFVGLAIANRFVVRIVLSELSQLAQEDREFAVREQRSYIEAWTGLVSDYSGEGAIAARIRVQAVLLVINDAVQTPHLRARPGFAATLRRIGDAMLGLPAA